MRWKVSSRAILPPSSVQVSEPFGGETRFPGPVFRTAAVLAQAVSIMNTGHDV